jgi:hypothetical protein
LGAEEAHDNHCRYEPDNLVAGCLHSCAGAGRLRALQHLEWVGRLKAHAHGRCDQRDAGRQQQADAHSAP